MSSRRRWRVLAATLLAAGAARLAQAAEEQSVGLVISGGVSLGAYQAGVSYTLMRYLTERRKYDAAAAPAGQPPPLTRIGGPLLVGEAVPRFSIATGSSAGNINAFLAALTWCDGEAFSQRRNLFWDTWLGVGLDKLSPEGRTQESYRKLFEEPILTENLGGPSDRGEGRTPDFPAQGEALFPGDGDAPVYTRSDGLLTRRAFAAAETHLKRRLDADRYRSCRVRLGLTATSAEPVALQDADDQGDGRISTQRFVVPLVLEARTPRPTNADHGVKLTLRNLAGRDWKPGAPNASRESIGKSMGLPHKRVEPAPEIAIDNVLRLIKASSAFPIAFAPVDMAVCLPAPGESPGPPSATGESCPADYRWEQRRFIDGGVFDNVPLGLAIELARRGAGGEAPARPVFIYVDDAYRRGQPEVATPVLRSNGFGFVGSLLGNFVTEARSYELQGLARYRADEAGFRDGRFFRSSRLFPVVGNFLAAFGAFFHPALRRHDYFVGIYDGLMTIARALTGPEASPAELRASFGAVSAALLDPDPEIYAFAQNLLEYELYWTNPTGAEAPQYSCQRAPLPGWDVHVWKTFEVLCTLDETGRRLVRQNDTAGFRRHEAAHMTLTHFMSLLPDDMLGDQEAWQYQHVDRLVRRAIDVQRSDGQVLRRNGRPASDTVERAALVGRLVLASAMEREHEVLDLDPSSVARVTAGRWPGAVFHLLPQFAVWDMVHSSVELGWEPKLRPTPRVFLPFGASGRWHPWREGSSTGWKLLLGGLGWDPAGRLFDDLQVGAIVVGDPAQPVDRSLGVEAAVRFGGDKLRFALGVPNLYARRSGEWAQVSGWRSAFDGLTLSVGVSDLNGALAWLARSGFGYLFDTHEESGEVDDGALAKGTR